MSALSLRIKLCGCFGKAMDTKVGLLHSNWLKGLGDGTLSVLDDIQPDQEPEFAKMVDNVLEAAENASHAKFGESMMELTGFVMKLAE